jgi:hypothetical protein
LGELDAVAGTELAVAPERGSNPGMFCPSQRRASGSSATHTDIRCPASRITTACTDVGLRTACRKSALEE